MSGLLQTKGKSGSGKSTLLKHAASYLSINGPARSNAIAVHFLDTAGFSRLQKTIEGLFRSLLFHQFQCYVFGAKAIAFAEEHAYRLEHSGHDRWDVPDLQNTPYSALTQPQKTSTTIIIDALDECESGVTERLRFPRKPLDAARIAGARLRICVSRQPDVGPTFLWALLPGPGDQIIMEIITSTTLKHT